MTKQIRVALCFGTFPPERNGGSDWVARYACALAERGHAVTVLTSRAGGPDTECYADGVTVHRIIDDWTLGQRGRAALRRAGALLRTEGVHLVHVVFPDSVVQERYLLPPLLGAGRIPLVSTHWNLALGPRTPMRLRLTSLALIARARALSAHEPQLLAVLRRLAVGRTVAWLPVASNLSAAAGAVTRDEARCRLGLDGASSYLGYFGQLDATRGVEDLFEALRLLRADRDVKLLMIGSAGRPERYRVDPGASAYYDSITGLPERLGIADAVRWTDYLPDAEVREALRAIDLAVLPYRRNSLGRSALAAALEAGVATLVGGSERDIEPLRADRDLALAPRSDPAGLAAAIRTLLDDGDRLRELSRAASAAAHVLSWDEVARRGEELYVAALGRRR